MFMWLFKEQRPRAPRWSNQRAYIAAEKVDLVNDDPPSGNCTLLLTAYLRAHGLFVNQLVNVAGAGDFPLSEIEMLKDPFPLNPRNEQDLMDTDDMGNGQVL